MLSFLSRAWLLVLVASLVPACKTGKTFRIVAAVCGERCGGDDPTRSVNDYTGLACATRARLRVYDADADLGTLGTVREEQCIDLADPATFGAIFAVDDGAPAATGVAKNNVKLLTDPAPGTVVVEIALIAPGAPAGCSSDGPVVALGRSAPFDAAGSADQPIDVPLGCHELCNGIAARTGTIGFTDVGTRTAVAAPSGAVLGDLSPREQMVSPGGLCIVRGQLFAGFSFLPYDASSLTSASGALALSGSFGTDPHTTGGCAALRSTVAEIPIYACIDRMDTAPTALSIDSAGAAAIAVFAAKKTNGRTGALVLALVHTDGTPAAGVMLTAPSNNLVIAAAENDFGLLTQTDTSSASGLMLVTEAPAGGYHARAAGGPMMPAFSAGGAEVGSITLSYVVVDR